MSNYCLILIHGFYFKNETKVEMTTKLFITEVYASIQGESSYVGKPCAFIRLAGCPLTCRWCDTGYAREAGQEMDVVEILSKVRRLGVRLVELTGGEPLAQDGVHELVEKLLDNKFEVLCETNGASSLKDLDKKVHVIMDIKCASSEMSKFVMWENLEYLKATDELKFVVANRTDFEWAVEVIKKHNLDRRFKVLIGAVFGELENSVLANWILDEKLQIRLNFPIHKFIWGPQVRGV